MNKYNPSVCVCVCVCVSVCDKDTVDWVSFKAENHFELRTIKEQQSSGRGPF